MCDVLSTFNSSTVTVLRVRNLGQQDITRIFNRMYEGWRFICRIGFCLAVSMPLVS